MHAQVTRMGLCIEVKNVELHTVCGNQEESVLYKNCDTTAKYSSTIWKEVDAINYTICEKLRNWRIKDHIMPKGESEDSVPNYSAVSPSFSFPAEAEALRVMLLNKWEEQWRDVKLYRA